LRVQEIQDKGNIIWVELSRVVPAHRCSNFNYIRKALYVLLGKLEAEMFMVNRMAQSNTIITYYIERTGPNTTTEMDNKEIRKTTKARHKQKAKGHKHCELMKERAALQEHSNVTRHNGKIYDTTHNYSKTYLTSHDT